MCEQATPTYIDLLNAFYECIDKREYDGGTPVEALDAESISLFCALAHIWNKSGRNEWFYAFNSAIERYSGLSQRTISRRRKTLSDLGLIKFRLGPTRTSSTEYCVSVVMSPIVRQTIVTQTIVPQTTPIVRQTIDYSQADYLNRDITEYNRDIDVHNECGQVQVDTYRTDGEPNQPDEVTTHGEAKEDTTPAAKKTKKRSLSNEEMEKRFYEAYPKKKQHERVRKWFKKNSPDDETFEKIMSGLEAAKAEWVRKNTETDFMPHPSTWLNDRRWEDETSTSAAPVSAAAKDVEFTKEDEDFWRRRSRYDQL